MARRAVVIRVEDCADELGAVADDLTDTLRLGGGVGQYESVVDVSDDLDVLGFEACAVRVQR